MQTRHVVVRFDFRDSIEMIRGRVSDDVEVHFPDTPTEFEALLPRADALYGYLEQSLFDRVPRLQWIQNHSTGWDKMDYPQMRESDIVVTGISGLLAPTVAEHAMALLLGLSRAIGPLRNQQYEQVWKVIPGRELDGLTACILGVGAIGRQIALRLKPFGMRTVGVDVREMPPPEGMDEVLLMDQLPQVLARSDALFICCPLTDETFHLIDEGALTQLRAGAFLINISRGGIVDESALVDALRSGRLGGAALDVTEKEPCPADSPLWNAPNLLLTPHSAGFSQFTLPRKRDRFIENLCRWAAGEPLVDVLPITKGGRR